MARGCRQWDLISPYLFVLALELLGETIRKHDEIRGISTREKEPRISQFVNDTTLFMEYNEKNLRGGMSILHQFYQISGLKINVEKTKAIKLRVIGYSMITLCDDVDFI